MSEDDPWIEHARWSTECIYVHKMKGEEFVSLVKMAEKAEREEAARSNCGANQALEHSSESVLAITAKEGSDVRDITVTSTTSQEWLKKNPDSDISLSFRDPGLSEEKDKIETCFHEHRKWPKSQPSVSGVQQEFTPLTSTEESVLIGRVEPYDASSLKWGEIIEINSDSSVRNIEMSSDFISLESEKNRVFCSELHFRDMENLLRFVSLKSNKKMRETQGLVHLKEGVKRQLISSSLKAFFETDDTYLHQVKDASEIEQQILSDMDVAVQKEKYIAEIDEKTPRDINLKERKKHLLRQIVWLQRNWLPLPRLGRDEIVGFIEEQTRGGHGGSTLPPAEQEELREMLRRLASDNVPGPQITMKYEMLRLCTMKTFPGQDRPFAIRIIGAGFYYAGHHDQVICYCCGNRKDNWVIGDIPLLIHQNKAPDCDFLTHNALVNVPIRKANSTESPSLAEVWLLSIQRYYGSNPSDMAHGESSLMLPSSEQNQVSILNTPHQMLVANKSSPSDLLMASGRQNKLDSLQTASADTYDMEEPPPKYPQYSVKNMRINSFQGWPAEHRQRPEEMAECGFYFEGFSDCVRCFSCGVGLRHWMSEDVPWTEHARWSTSCTYVHKMKGEQFVSLVKMAVDIAERKEAARSNSGGNQAEEHSSEATPVVTAKEDSMELHQKHPDTFRGKVPQDKDKLNSSFTLMCRDENKKYLKGRKSSGSEGIDKWTITLRDGNLQNSFPVKSSVSVLRMLLTCQDVNGLVICLKDTEQCCLEIHQPKNMSGFCFTDEKGSCVSDMWFLNLSTNMFIPRNNIYDIFALPFHIEALTPRILNRPVYNRYQNEYYRVSTFHTYSGGMFRIQLARAGFIFDMESETVICPWCGVLAHNLINDPENLHSHNCEFRLRNNAVNIPIIPATSLNSPAACVAYEEISVLNDHSTPVQTAVDQISSNRIEFEEPPRAIAGREIDLLPAQLNSPLLDHGDLQLSRVVSLFSNSDETSVKDPYTDEPAIPVDISTSIQRDHNIRLSEALGRVFRGEYGRFPEENVSHELNSETENGISVSVEVNKVQSELQDKNNNAKNEGFEFPVRGIVAVNPGSIMEEYIEPTVTSLCIACMVNRRSMIFVPCGHLVTCSDCADTFRKCPECRKRIQEILPIFPF